MNWRSGDSAGRVRAWQRLGQHGEGLAMAGWNLAGVARGWLWPLRRGRGQRDSAGAVALGGGVVSRALWGSASRERRRVERGRHLAAPQEAEKGREVAAAERLIGAS